MQEKEIYTSMSIHVENFEKDNLDSRTHFKTSTINGFITLTSHQFKLNSKDLKRIFYGRMVSIMDRNEI